MLMFLPSYSPALNPAGLLWREIRAKQFYNKIFDSLDDVESSLEHALARGHRDPGEIKKSSKGCTMFNKIDSGLL